MNDLKTDTHRRIYFIEMMGEPGSYDASVYDHFKDKDNEGLWFVNRFGGFPGIKISTCNVCKDEALPDLSAVDGLVLAGSYNSVHDHTGWQQRMRAWLPQVQAAKIPLLAVCGSHQLLAHIAGSGVTAVEEAPFAGTFPIEITEEGRLSPLLQGIDSSDCFQYANGEHVVGIPRGATLLASSSKVPVAALDYGNHCYSTQFHPEGTCETLSTVWRYSQPGLMANYHNQEKGGQLVENFLRIVTGRTGNKRGLA